MNILTLNAAEEPSKNARRICEEMHSRRYHGEIAEGYDAKREEQPKWHEENRIVREFLIDLPRGTSVLDVPVGTGRFIPLYEELGFNVLGLDISEDMLREASQKVKADTTYLRTGNAIELDLPDKSYDVAVCIRLFRWITPAEVQKVLSELQRVAKKRIIFNARIAHHPHQRPISLLRGALVENWSFTRIEEIEPNYLMFMWERPELKVWSVTSMVEKPGA